MFLRLRELILRERNAKTRLQIDIRQVKEEAEKLGKELERSKQKEEDQHKALQTLEEALSKLESQKAHQQASEVDFLVLNITKDCVNIALKTFFCFLNFF